jgi:hypothetical protein
LGRTDESATWGKRAHVAARALAQADGSADDIVVVDLDADGEVSADEDSEALEPDARLDDVETPLVTSDRVSDQPRGDGVGDVP